MKALLASLLLLAAASTAAPAAAALNVLACTPEWAALAAELGGDKVSVFAATHALQDPHRVEARPSLIARARRADLMICTGAELEVGWAPLVQTQSGNAKIQAGQPGYFEAASVAALIDKPARLDRSQGDVHPAGNPHLHLDPRNIAKVAAALGERMAALDPPEAAHYRARTQAFLQRWAEASARWQKAAVRLKDVPIVVHHRDLSYLIAWLGMREVAAWAWSSPIGSASSRKATACNSPRSLRRWPAPLCSTGPSACGRTCRRRSSAWRSFSRRTQRSCCSRRTRTAPNT